MILRVEYCGERGENNEHRTILITMKWRENGVSVMHVEIVGVN